jgi:hypothetical protein
MQPLSQALRLLYTDGTEWRVRVAKEAPTFVRERRLGVPQQIDEGLYRDSTSPSEQPRMDSTLCWMERATRILARSPSAASG